MSFLLRLKPFVPQHFQRTLRKSVWKTVMRSGLKDLLKSSMYAAWEYHREWRLEEALAAVDARIQKGGEVVSTRLLRAKILTDLGHHADARAEALALLERDPLNLEALDLLSALGHPVAYDLGVVKHEVSREASTPQRYLAATRYLNAGGFFEEAELLSLGAEASCRDQRKAFALDPIVLERAISLEGQGKLADAIVLARSVGAREVRLAARHLIARCELELGNPEAAARILGHDPASESPPARHDKALLPILYALDDLKNAHLSYRKRPTSRLIASTFEMPSPDEICLKSGRHCNDAAFIFAEGGPGDEIRLSTLYGELEGYFRSVSISCDPRLYDLFTRSFPKINFIPVARYRNEFRLHSLADRKHLPDRSFWNFANDEAIEAARESDFVCSSLDLLGELRQNRQQFRDNSSRLVPNRTDFVPTTGRLRVGIAWRSLLISSARNLHYLDAPSLAPLSRLTNCEFWSLQAGTTAHEEEILRSVLPDLNVFRGLDIKDDLDTLAANMKTLDLVISPATNIVELAGALDVPTILLSTSHSTTWRRNSDGSDVWYRKGRVIHADPVSDRDQLVGDLTHLLQRMSPRSSDL